MTSEPRRRTTTRSVRAVSCRTFPWDPYPIEAGDQDKGECWNMYLVAEKGKWDPLFQGNSGWWNVIIRPDIYLERSILLMVAARKSSLFSEPGEVTSLRKGHYTLEKKGVVCSCLISRGATTTKHMPQVPHVVRYAPCTVFAVPLHIVWSSYV